MDLIKEEVLKNVKEHPIEREYKEKEDFFSRAILCEGKTEWTDTSGTRYSRQDECNYQEVYTITQPEANQTEYNIGFTIMKTISVPDSCPTLRQTIPALSGRTYRWIGRNYDEPDLIGINFTQRETPKGTSFQISFLDRQGENRLIWRDEKRQAEVSTPELSEVFDNWNAKYINPWLGFFNKEGTFLEKWDAQATSLSSCIAGTVLAGSDLEPIDREFIEKIYYGSPLPKPTAPMTTTWYSDCKKGWNQTICHHKKEFQEFLQRLRENSR